MCILYTKIIYRFNTSDVSVELIFCRNHILVYTRFNTSDVSVELGFLFLRCIQLPTFQYFRCFGWIHFSAFIIVPIKCFNTSDVSVELIKFQNSRFLFYRVSILQMFRLNFFFDRREKLREISFNTSDVSVEFHPISI